MLGDILKNLLKSTNGKREKKRRKTWNKHKPRPQKRPGKIRPV